MWRLKFYDAIGNICEEYDPRGQIGQQKIIEIAENETLVGIYGDIEDGYNYFTRFNFIVKVREETDGEAEGPKQQIFYAR